MRQRKTENFTYVMFTVYYFVPPCIVQRGGTLPNEGSNGKVD